VGAVCMPGCVCGPGTQLSSCDGQPCYTPGACLNSSYGCAVCGAVPGPVTCSGYTCPLFSVCGSKQDCACLSGYHAVSCGGHPYNGASFPPGNWWCYPD
jgi:hypothetical protein